MCALFVAAGAVFVACSDDDDDDETTDYGAAVAIAKINASSESFAGVSDFYALTFADFSNETNDPIYIRGGTDANGKYTYAIAFSIERRPFWFVSWATIIA